MDPLRELTALPRPYMYNLRWTLRDGKEKVREAGKGGGRRKSFGGT